MQTAKSNLVSMRRLSPNKLDSHARETLSKGAVAFMLKIMGAGLGFLFQVAIARYLGASGSGVYFLSLTIITIAAIVARLGMDNSVTRFVAAHASENDWAKVKGVVRHALRIALILAIIASTALFFSVNWLAAVVFDMVELAKPLKLMSLLIVPISLLWIYACALQGLKKMRDAVLMQSVLIPLLAIIALYYLVPLLGISGAVLAYGFGVIVTLLFGFAVFQRTKLAWKKIAPGFSSKTLIAASLPLLVAVLLQQLIQAMPLLLLGAWGNSSDVGLFGAAQRTAGLVSLVLITANTTLSPKFAELYQQRDMGALERMAKNGQKTVLAMALPVLLVLLVLPEWVMGLYGPEFSAGWLLLVIISFGQLVNVATGSVESLLIMSGNEKAFLKAGLFSTFITIVLCAWLIPLYGKEGAAVAFSVSLAAVNLLRVGYVWQTLSINVLSFRYKTGRR